MILIVHIIITIDIVVFVADEEVADSILSSELIGPEFRLRSVVCTFPCLCTFTVS